MCMAGDGDDRFLDLNVSQKIDPPEIVNKFLERWMYSTDCNGDALKMWIKVLKKNGHVWCDWCQTELNYGRNGISVLKKHAGTSVHKKKRKVLGEIAKNQALPSAFQKQQCKEDGISTTTSGKSTSDLDV